MQMRDPIPHVSDHDNHVDAQTTAAKSFGMIGGVTSVIIIICAVFATDHGYRIAPVFLLPLLWGVYGFRHWLHLQPRDYALFAIALVLHDIGAFGMYQRSVLGVSFDIYVHFYFAFAVTFIIERAMLHRLSINPWWVRIATVLFMMGFGALHEIMEYGTYLALGEEGGMLRPTTSYQFDTQRDLLNNLLGTLLALTLSAIARRRSVQMKTTETRVGEPISPPGA